MSRQDQGAATATDVYPVDPRCVCGCLAVLHAIGQRGGQQVRTGCSTSACECRRYAAAVPDPPRCDVCGTAHDPIEAARKESHG